jgi:tetratricopeptide (TPR) repeat protein
VSPKRLSAVLFLAGALCAAARVAVQPGLVGTWETSEGAKSYRWTVRSDSSYDFFIFENGRQSHHSSGVMQASADQFSMRSRDGEVTRGSYRHNGSDNLTTLLVNGHPIVWTRVRASSGARERSGGGGAGSGLTSLSTMTAQDAYKIGMALKDKGEFAGATLAMSRAVEAQPNWVEARYQRGVLLIKMIAYGQQGSANLNRLVPRTLFGTIGYLSEAVKDLTFVVRAQPTNKKAFCMRGICHLQMLNFDYAVADLSRAIAIDPDYAFPYGYRAIVRIDQFRDPGNDLARCYSLDPSLRSFFEQQRSDALEFRHEYRAMQVEMARRRAAAAAAPPEDNSFVNDLYKRREDEARANGNTTEAEHWSHMQH